MPNRNIIIHIGFPKCASSFIQKNLFSKCDDYLLIASDELINVTGKVELNSLKKDFDLYKQILDYVNGNLSLKNTLIKNLEKQINKFNGRLIFTSEWITAPRYVRNTPLDRVKLLCEILPKDAKIIMVVRDHTDLIISLYRDNQISFFNNRYLSFNEFLEEILSTKLSSRFLYSSVYKLLIEKFSEDNIYFYKLKKNKSHNISEEINNDLQINNKKDLRIDIVNEGITNSQFRYLLFIRKFIFIKKLIPKKIYSYFHFKILKFLKFGNKYKINISKKSLDKINSVFEHDWIYISKKLRN